MNNINPAWTLIVGGWITTDAMYNSARPVAPGTPFFLTPQGPFDDDTFGFDPEVSLELDDGQVVVVTVAAFAESSSGEFLVYYE